MQMDCPTEEGLIRDLGITSRIVSSTPAEQKNEQLLRKQAETLLDISAALRANHNLSFRHAFIQGSDTFTEQDVGLRKWNERRKGKPLPGSGCER
jgi:hypothetical protein